MFISKKITKKIGAVMALAMLGGFSYEAVPSLSAPTAEAMSIASPSYGVSHDMKIKEPKNISTFTMYPENKQYLTSDFPMQKIGTTKSFKSNKSSGTIKYTAQSIIVTENVNRTNPKFTYIKKLPSGVKLADIKSLGPNNGFGYTSLGGSVWEGYADIEDKTYGTSNSVSFMTDYVNKDTVRVTMEFPNQYYNEQKVKLNREAEKKFKAELEAEAKKQYSINDSKGSISEEFPILPINSTTSFRNQNSEGKINYSEDGIYIKESVSKNNPKFTYLTGIDTKSLKGKVGESYTVSKTCSSGLTTYEYYVDVNRIHVKALIPYDGTYNNGPTAKSDDLHRQWRELDSKEKSLTKELNTLTLKENSLSSQLKTVNNQIANLEKNSKNASTQSAKLKALESQKSKEEAALTTLKKKKTTINNQLKFLEKQKDNAKNAIQLVQTFKKIKTLQNQQNTVNKQISAQNKKIASINKQVTALLTEQKTSKTPSSNLNQLKSKASNLTKQLETVQSSKKEVQKKMNTVKADKEKINYRELAFY